MTSQTRSRRADKRLPALAAAICTLAAFPAAAGEGVFAPDTRSQIAGTDRGTSGAVQPTVNTESTKVAPPEGAPDDKFGFAVALDGDRLAIGVPFSDRAAVDGGAACIFERNRGGAGNWGEVVCLTGSDTVSGDEFGAAIDLDGDRLVVGARSARDVSPPDSGAAYVFERNEGGADVWGQVAKLTASDPATGDHFGYAVGVSADTIVVGAELADAVGANSGAAYVFERNVGGATSWIQFQKLVPSDAAAGDLFGSGLSLDGATLAIGAPKTGDAGTDSGATYLFERGVGGTEAFGEVKKLLAGDADTGDRFGTAVALSRDTLVVGSVFDDDLGSSSGSAYVFERNEGGIGNWGQRRKLLASDGAEGDVFGGTVAVDGDTILVGAQFDDDAGNLSGSSYMFDRNESGADNWGEAQKHLASDGDADDRLGFAVAVSGDTAVSGAILDNVSGVATGSAYVFVRRSCALPDGSRIVAGDAAAEAQFGFSLDASGDTAVVGAFGDAEGGPFAGAAYVLKRDAGGVGNWDLVRKLTASDPQLFGQLGHAVALDKRVLVVGAPLSGSGALANSGAAYVFERDAGGADNWGEVQRLTAVDAAFDDRFGVSVTVADNLIAVGASREDDLGPDSGAVYVFERNAGDGTWEQSAKLTAPDGVGGESFGESIALFGDALVAGAPGAGPAGNAFVFRRHEGGLNAWGLVATLDDPDGAGGDRFGGSADAHADTVAIGAPGSSSAAPTGGVVHLFERNRGGADAWGAWTTLSASDASEADAFGSDVALSDGLLAVGARGVEAGRGAIYVFRADAGGADAWDEERILGAVEASTGDQYGAAVALDGDLVLGGLPTGDDFGNASGAAYVYAVGYDDDGDGFCADDCNDGVPEGWSVPEEITDLGFDDSASLGWTQSGGAGGLSLVYDTLRSAAADDFFTAACIESGDGSDETAVDPDSPAEGRTFFYLVRAVNDCPGSGSLGVDSSGAPREGRNCP